MLNKGKGGFCGVQSSDWRSRYSFYAEGQWTWEELRKLEEPQPENWYSDFWEDEWLPQKQGTFWWKRKLPRAQTWIKCQGMSCGWNTGAAGCLGVDAEHCHCGLEKLAGGMNQGHRPYTHTHTHAGPLDAAPKHTLGEGRRSPAPTQAWAPICTYLHSMNTC